MSDAKAAKAGVGEVSVNEIVDFASLTACCRSLSPGSLPGLLDLLYINFIDDVSNAQKIVDHANTLPTQVQMDLTSNEA
jgi:hypothetical protein